MITIALFKSLPLKSALLAGLLWGYLLLPERFSIDFPLVPPVDKRSITVFAILMCLILFRENTRQRGRQPETGSFRETNRAFRFVLFGLIGLLFLSQVMTVLDNRAPLIIGPLMITGLGVRDIISSIVKNIVLIVPFFLAYRFFRTPEDHRFILNSLVLAGLIYAFFILIEARLSPQLNNWVYGYHQHSFAQHIRGGSFRAKVFLQHGLSVGLFILTTVLAAAAMSRNSAYPAPGKWLIACIFLLAILALSRNLGALGLALMFLPLVFLRIGLQVRIAALIAIVFVSYPAARQANLIPLDQISEFTTGISEDRAGSFMFRLHHEDKLMERASEKPLFGWGSWGRNRIYDEQGRDISVTDGLWIIVLGQSGWIGYVSFFGILILPVVMLWRSARKRDIPPETAGIALITAANLIYLVPNSALSPLGWFLSGALAGFLQYRFIALADNDDVSSKNTKLPASSTYTRFPPRPVRT
ncbi:O-antigen ligase [Roseobacter sp. OBYS 0001]|uniref:O-antigen ligase family protein n=1 Tax=Roseobacter sp. OBYS 0001 TaxID=882651 RepID=UPI001C8037EB|nr:hypothetical protein [Roseobacter sp. OBYS 0001]